MIDEQRATYQFPDEFLAVFAEMIAPVEGLEAPLQTPPQRPREDAAAYRAAEAAGKPPERAQQARGDVVGFGQCQVEEVRHGVVQGSAGEESVEEDEGNIEIERGIFGGRHGQCQKADAE